MTRRIITADEARVLREAATPGPWLCWSDAEVSTTPSGAPDDGGDIVAMTYSATNNAIIAAAPDLAATVEALHAEVARLQDRDAAYWSGYADGYGGGHTADTIRATVEALHAEVARLRALVREAYREGFAASDEMGWHSDDSASETRWLASAARAALEVTP